MDFVIDAIFVMTVTAFFQTQFLLKGWRVLVCAFLVTLVFSFAPLIAVALPAFSPWLDALLQTIWLFISAAGSVDLVRYFTKKR